MKFGKSTYWWLAGIFAAISVVALVTGLFGARFLNFGDGGSNSDIIWPFIIVGATALIISTVMASLARSN